MIAAGLPYAFSEGPITGPMTGHFTLTSYGVVADVTVPGKRTRRLAAIPYAYPVKGPRKPTESKNSKVVVIRPRAS